MPPFGPPPHNHNIESKEKPDFKSVGKLFTYVKSNIVWIIIAVVFAMVGALTTILGPEYIGNLTNTIMTGAQSIAGVNMTEFIDTLVFLICLYAAGAFANYIQQFIMAGVSQKTSKKLRSDINSKLNKLPLKFFDNTTRGDVLSRVTNDVDIISHTFGNTISNLVNAITLFVGVLIKMFSVNWVLSLITIGTSIIGFLMMFIILRISQKYFYRRQKDLGDMNGHIEEIYTNHTIVKAYSATDSAKHEFNKINHSLFVNNWKSQALSGLMPPIMGFAGNLSYALIFIIGVAMILSGSTAVSFGIIISFTIYARLFSQPLNTFSQAMNNIQQTAAATKRVFEILDAEEMAAEEKLIDLSNIKGNVEFKNVKFGYNPNKTIIKNFSAKLKKGQKVAIVGPTGAGKTTIVNLLMRFYEVDEGDILIDGTSIKQLTRTQTRDLFDMILQDTWLFDGTIRENLIFNQTNVSDEKLNEICKAVGLEHFISTLENGYDTPINSAAGLSEGQKQQLTIARAMIKDSPLLILDEATSNVDTRTEIVIQKAMDKLTEGRTSFIIAHRLSTIKNADIILVLKDGDIIEQGNHKTLLAQNGFYADLYNSQFAIVD